MDEGTRLKMDKNYKRMRAVERRFPWVRRITRHPTIGPWIPAAVAAVEVASGLLRAGAVAGKGG